MNDWVIESEFGILYHFRPYYTRIGDLLANKSKTVLKESETLLLGFKSKSGMFCRHIRSIIWCFHALYSILLNAFSAQIIAMIFQYWNYIQIKYKLQTNEKREQNSYVWRLSENQRERETEMERDDWFQCFTCSERATNNWIDWQLRLNFGETHD